MDSSLSAPEAALPEGSGLPSHILVRIASATTPDQIVSILRDYAPPDIDRVSLTGISLGNVAETVSVWDRDNVALESGLPGPIRQLIGEKPLFITGDIDLDQSAALFRAYVGGTLRAKSLAVFPLNGHEQIVGYLELASRHPRFYSEQEVERWQALAAYVAVNLEKLLLLDTLSHQLEEATVLYSTSLAMNAAQSLEEVYETALTQVAFLSQASRVLIYLAGPDPRSAIQYVERVAVWENDQAMFEHPPERYALGEVPVLSQFPMSRANLVFNDLQADTRLESDLRSRYARQGINALVMIPLATGSAWLGALLLEASRGQFFSGEQVRLCRSIADQAALAVDLQTLLARAQQTAERERALRRITEHIRNADSVESILHIAEQELKEALGKSPEELESLSWRDERALSKADWDLVEDVGNQVALAIENLKLLESTRQAALRGQVVGELMSKLQRVVSVEEVMEITAQTLHSVLADYNISLRLLPQRPAASEKGATSSRDDSSEGEPE
jgi:GAF domain-containing protein